MSQETKNQTFAVTACAIGVFITSFMPWGAIQASPEISVASSSSSDPMTLPNLMGDMTWTVNLNGWSGTTSILGVTSPNWLPIAIAISVAIIAWLHFLGAWKTPKLLMPVLSGLGLLQLLSLLVVLVFSKQGQVGLGLVLSSVLFVFLVKAVIGLSVASPELNQGTPLPPTTN